MIIEDEAGEEEHGLLLKKVKNILLQTDFKGKKCCKEKHRKKSKPTQVMNKKKKQSSRTYRTYSDLSCHEYPVAQS